MSQIRKAMVTALLTGGAVVHLGVTAACQEPETPRAKAASAEKSLSPGDARRRVWFSEPWTVAAPAFAIADNLYYVGNQRFSSHLVVGKKGMVLIDTPYKEHCYVVTESIRSLGFDPADITLILHTHYHYDHVGSTRRLKELSGATVAMGADDIELLQAPRTRNMLINYGKRIDYGIYPEPFEVDRPLRHGDQIDLGDTTIHCHHTPGHSPGAMSFTFGVTIDGNRHTALLFGGPGLNVFKDRGLYYPGAEEDFAKTLDYLATLEADVFLGAHPFLNKTLEKHERLKKGEKPNPFIDRDGWLRFLANIKKNYDQIMADRE